MEDYRIHNMISKGRSEYFICNHLFFNNVTHTIEDSDIVQTDKVYKILYMFITHKWVAKIVGYKRGWRLEIKSSHKFIEAWFKESLVATRPVMRVVCALWAVHETSMGIRDALPLIRCQSVDGVILYEIRSKCCMIITHRMPDAMYSHPSTVVCLLFFLRTKQHWGSICWGFMVVTVTRFY